MQRLRTIVEEELIVIAEDNPRWAEHREDILLQLLGRQWRFVRREHSIDFYPYVWEYPPFDNFPLCDLICRMTYRVQG